MDGNQQAWILSSQYLQSALTNSVRTPASLHGSFSPMQKSRHICETPWFLQHCSGVFVLAVAPIHEKIQITVS